MKIKNRRKIYGTKNNLKSRANKENVFKPSVKRKMGLIQPSKGIIKAKVKSRKRQKKILSVSFSADVQIIPSKQKGKVKNLLFK